MEANTRSGGRSPEAAEEILQNVRRLLGFLRREGYVFSGEAIRYFRDGKPLHLVPSFVQRQSIAIKIERIGRHCRKVAIAKQFRLRQRRRPPTPAMDSHTSLGPPRGLKEAIAMLRLPIGRRWSTPAIAIAMLRLQRDCEEWGRCGVDGCDEAGAGDEVDCAVVMAGVLGIYGLIIAVIISTKINPKTKSYFLFDGYAHLSSGIACGLAGLSTSMAINIVGDAGG
ncbi:PREDICTED: uncharacterized protein LOC109165198 [Ipomoea nil]|uniref:uncharacterized protein LOC109165198 n=1 Tax=Ipomoea nil TaxID=35883 RepID=UPI0009011321|nr:PREDICTED: uncharacterized protein LOC109165198 [Ipomoea nil]